ncbi:MAG: hypothetical protein JXR27_09615 [Paludibacteraceae bacterium]|nr:hypothetical protein [Paludibacteraceae bacterium]
MIFLSLWSYAQERYRAEIGPVGGTSFYLGDANSKLFANQQAAFGLQYRQKFNSRLALSADWHLTDIVGEGMLPNAVIQRFDNRVNAFDLSGEFNFFDLEDKPYRPFSRKYSTFIFAGVGGMHYLYEQSPQLKFSYMFGVGAKFMLSDKLNLQLKWSNRLLLTDQLEGVRALNNPGHLNGSNLLNNDLLSTFSVGLTVNIFKERCNCNNNW